MERQNCDLHHGTAVHTTCTRTIYKVRVGDLVISLAFVSVVVSPHQPSRLLLPESSRGPLSSPHVRCVFAGAHHAMLRAFICGGRRRAPSHRMRDAGGAPFHQHVLSALESKGEVDEPLQSHASDTSSSSVASAAVPSDIASSLASSRRAGRMRRLAISGPPGIVAVVMLTSTVVLLTLYPPDTRPFLVGGYLMFLFAPFWLLVLLPTDRSLLLGTGVAMVVGYAFMALEFAGTAIELYLTATAPDAATCNSAYTLDVMVPFYLQCAFAVALYSLRVGAALASERWSMWRAHRALHGRYMLRRLWLDLCISNLVLALSLLWYVLVQAAVLPGYLRSFDALSTIAFFFESSGAAYVCWDAPLQRRVQGWLGARGEGVSAAAGIASLVAEAGSPDELIATAVSRLRAVRSELLTADIFIRPTPTVAHSGAADEEAAAADSKADDDRWYRLSEPAPLYAIDAFVSHSVRARRAPAGRVAAQRAAGLGAARDARSPPPAPRPATPARAAAGAAVARRRDGQVAGAAALVRRVPTAAPPQAAAVDRPGVHRPEQHRGRPGDPAGRDRGLERDGRALRADAAQPAVVRLRDLHALADGHAPPSAARAPGV